MSEAVVAEQVEEPQSNHYNARKPWDKTGEVKRGLLSPNSTLADADPSKGDIPTEATQDEVEVPKEDSTQYKKVDYKKRHDDLKRHYDKKLVEWKAEVEQLEARASSNAPKSIPKTPEELATFKEQYPDVYDVVESVAQQQAEEQLGKVQKEIEVLKEREMESAMRESRLVLEKLQPDVDAIIESEEFHEWAKDQPSQIQEWVYDNPDNPTLASRAIDLFKKDVGYNTDKKEETKRKRKPKADAAEAVIVTENVEPNAGEKKVWKTSEIESLSIYQYESLKDEIDLAFKEQRIVQG